MFSIKLVTLTILSVALLLIRFFIYDISNQLNIVCNCFFQRKTPKLLVFHYSLLNVRYLLNLLVFYKMKSIHRNRNHTHSQQKKKHNTTTRKIHTGIVINKPKSLTIFKYCLTKMIKESYQNINLKVYFNI